MLLSSPLFIFAFSGAISFADRCLLSLQMCGVLEDSGARALNSFCGDKAASSSLVNSLHQLEKVCEGVDRILRVQENGTTSKEEVVDASVKEATPPGDAVTEAVNGDLPSTVKPEDKMEVEG
jgi:chromodomain-helicase-DNA-binding protein 4